MQVTVIYTFPLMTPVMRPLCTSLQRGPYDGFGFVIKALSHLPSTAHDNFSFFELDAIKKTVSQHSFSLPYGHIGKMSLYHDRERGSWVLAVERSEGSLELYEMHSRNYEQWTRLFWIDRKDVGLGEKALVAMWQQDKLHPFVFYMRDIAEVSDSPVYWTWWKPSTHVDREAPQLIEYCDTVVPYVAGEGCLLFLCQRSFHEEPPEPDLRRGPGDWRISVAAYQSVGGLLRKEILPDITFPIQNLKLPDQDLLTWLAVRMSVTDGPRYEPDGKQTCVAALVLQDTSRESEEGGQQTIIKGGLYCLDMQARIVQHEPTPLGTQISLCLCGEKVVGTDVFGGHRRLWQWSPQAGTKQRVHTYLAPEVRRVTLVAMEEQQDGGVPQFWCVQEYSNGVRVSQWESDQLRELQAVWCEGLSLMDELVGPYLRDRRLKGLAVYQDTLLLLGIDKEKHLKLLQISS